MRSIAQNRNRTVIDKMDRHRRLKYARLDDDFSGAGAIDKVIVKDLGLFGAGGAIEARPPAFPAVAIQSELRHNQKASAHIEARFSEMCVKGGTLVWPGGADLFPDVIIWGSLPPDDAAVDAA